MIRLLSKVLFDRSVALRADIPESPEHWQRESYIPLHAADLAAWLVEQDPGSQTQKDAFRELIRLLDKKIHRHFRDIHDKVCIEYRLLDPDRETLLSIEHAPPSSSDAKGSKVTSHNEDGVEIEIEKLLIRANYRRLTPRQILTAIRTASHWGVRLRIRLSTFHRLRVYARGDVLAQKSRRTWRRAYRLQHHQVPIYQRLVILFQLKGRVVYHEHLAPDKLHVRMFKNIPKDDVDMLLPASSIQMNWLDHGRIGVPTVWGFSTLIAKLVKNASLIAVFFAWKAISSVLLVIAIVLASLVYGVRSFFSYVTTKRRYLLSVAQNLYYQNLDNNLGVVLRLLEEAEQQEICESILAYYVLSKSESEQGMDERSIDEECERLLRLCCGCDIDFEAPDAIRDLLKLRIVEGTEHGYRGVNPLQAIEILSRTVL